MTIDIKRIYEPVEEKDGYRVLVDRLWPRGISKKEARIDLWLKEAAPSTNLRKWFNHEPEKWDEFKKQYFAEMDNYRQLLQSFVEDHKNKKITLVYGSRDIEHNQAVVLRNYLERLVENWS
jgi:uncharacterized protein YeaO (DUF488 family)